MDKKQGILKLMEEELDRAKKLPVERVSENVNMSVQYVYENLKKSFEETYIPEHILEILSDHIYPLSRFYDYFFNEGDIRIGVDWNKMCKDYALYRECEVVEEKLHDKVEVEYRKFMESVVEMAPYKTGKIITEIALKMQAFSIFRYQDLFGMDDMKLLQDVDKLLDKMFQKHDGRVIPMDDEHLVWAKAYDYLEKVVEDAKELIYTEENAMEA